MRTFLSRLVWIPAAVLAGCNLVSVDNAPVSVSSISAMSEDASSVRETSNVSYSGVVQPSGISIYTEGSHRLVLPEGKFILLESDALDLNGYVGENVVVFGSLRPTVEAGGMIMRVDRIELADGATASGSSLSSSSSSDSSELSSALSEVSAESVASSEAVSKAESAASKPASSAASTAQSKATVASSTSSSAVKSSAVSKSSQQEASQPETDAQFETRVLSMSHQNLESAQWTQQYCTSHIGFCAPVHRNWWFKSFGATSTELWHVEINSEPLDMLGDGPVVIRLMTGADTAADGTVTTQGAKVTFIKSWSLDRHFEIVADKRLEAIVRYIGTHLTEFAQSL